MSQHHYLHHVPGRLRVRIPALKASKSAAEALKQLVRAQHGIRSVEVSPITGSVLVHYDPAVANHRKLLQLLQSTGFRAHSPACAAAPPVKRRTVAPVPSQVYRLLGQFVLEKAIEHAATALVAAIL